MAAEFEKSGVTEFAYTYRDIPDSDVDRYVAFHETRAGRNYSAAVVTAYDKVLTRAALDFGTQLGIAKPPPGTKS